MNYLSSVVFLIVLGSALAYSGQFVPKSFYVIDNNGHKSDVVYIRTRRDSEFEPADRIRRSGSSSSATSYSSASASSSSSSSSGSAPVYYGDAGGFPPNYAQGGYSNLNYDTQHLPQGATIFSRFGEEPGSGVEVAGSAQGPRGAFSSSSTSVDDKGKVKYSVQSGKY